LILRSTSALAGDIYRILLGVAAGLKRGFHFDQAAQQRWSKRELQRQIDRALFERVALSRDTKALVRLDKQRGPLETVCFLVWLPSKRVLADRLKIYSRMLTDEDPVS
jgi:hypothetical protein